MAWARKRRAIEVEIYLNINNNRKNSTKYAGI